MVEDILRVMPGERGEVEGRDGIEELESGGDCSVSVSERLSSNFLIRDAPLSGDDVRSLGGLMLPLLRSGEGWLGIGGDGRLYLDIDDLTRLGNVGSGGGASLDTGPTVKTLLSKRANQTSDI